MSSSEKLDQLAAALVSAQALMPAVPKASENPFYHSRYADFSDVVGKIGPILSAHGLAISQFVSHDGDRNTLVTWLLHSSGQFICDEMLLMLPKDDPQGQGSAITYAKRYAYQAAAGVRIEGDDDDGNKAAQSTSRPQAARDAKRSGPPSCVRCGEPLEGPVKNLGGGQYAHVDCVEPADSVSVPDPVPAGTETEQLKVDA